MTFQSHVGRLQQRGLISYAIPKLFDNDKFKLIYTIFYDNSLMWRPSLRSDWKAKIDLRQQIGSTGREPGTRPGPSSITYRFDFRRVKASNFAEDFSPGEIALLSLPARVGGPGFTFIRDKRDNPLESTKGNYFTLDGFASSKYFGSEADFGRVLGTEFHVLRIWGKGKPGRQFVFARSTTIGLEQPLNGTSVLPPGSCPLNAAGEPTCTDITTIPLPEQFFAGGGNSHRGFGLNQAGPRDPSSGFPVGGTALFVNNLELRFPPISLPYLGRRIWLCDFSRYGECIHRTARHVEGTFALAPAQSRAVFVQWYNDLLSAVTNSITPGYDYTSHAVGVGVRYKTPSGPCGLTFGYNLNPTSYFQATYSTR